MDGGDVLYVALTEFIPVLSEMLNTRLKCDEDNQVSFELQVTGQPDAIYERDVPEDKFGRVLMCAHVRRGMYVSPRGNVLPCMSMVGTPIEEQFPNMLETPLEEILDGQSAYMDITNYRISDYMEHNPECRTCEYRTACCGGCRAMAVQDNPADYLAKDRYTCAYFKGGWKERKDALLRRIGRPWIPEGNPAEKPGR